MRTTDIVTATARTLALLVAILGGESRLHAQTTSRISDEASNLHLFLLAGQSNMAGRGKVELQDRQPHDRVLVLNQAGEFVPAIDPLHFDKPQIVGVGLGKTFGVDYAKAHPGVTVGLVPCAVGGSPLASWQPGSLHEQTGTYPYDDCIRRMRVAMKSGTLQGILWHQGESDSTQDSSHVYEERLIELISRMRQAFDAPEVPFIIGQLGRFEGRPWNEFRERVNDAHQAIPARVRKTGFVSSDGLSHAGDKLHFNAESQRTLGHRYFQVFQAVVAAE